MNFYTKETKFLSGYTTKNIKDLPKYLDWIIDYLEPTTKEFQLKLYESKGYIERGKEVKDLPSFEQWNKLYCKIIPDSSYVNNLTRKY